MWPVSKCITILIKQEEDLPHKPLPVPGKVTEQLLGLAKYMQKGAGLSEQIYQSRFIKCREELPDMWEQLVGEGGENGVM